MSRSVTVHDDHNDEIFSRSGSETEESSTGSVVSEELSTDGSDSRRLSIVGELHGVEKLEGGREREVIERSFVLGMGRCGKETNVVAVHKSVDSSLIGRARMESFRIFSEAVARKRGGNANVRFGWFGGSREEIVEVVNHGFSGCGRPKSGGSGGGVGVHLSHGMFSIDSALCTEPDEDGLRHVLLCQVISGKMETIPDGSNQNYPSSDQFDIGVDDRYNPRRYIVWSAFMNSHILPKYIISFRSPPLKSIQRNQQLNLATTMRPISSPWMSFPILVCVLSRFLDNPRMLSIIKHHSDFRARRITRPQLVRRLRQIAGDELLTHVIKLHINK